MTRTLVLGADGQLGGEFVRTLQGTCHVVGADIQQVDVRHQRELARFVRDARPDTIINCAAWNGVDQAEQCPLDALGTNALAVRYLSMLVAESGATLVHFSTDFVFDGAAATPYLETDQPAPISMYGMSKLLGEVAAEAATQRYVLRLSSLYGGPQQRSYIDSIANALRAGREVPVFVDRIVSPSFVPDVVDATLRLIRNRAPFGIYHCASSDCCSWYDLGLEIARQISHVRDSLQPVQFSNQPGRARRPRFCALSTQKLADAVGPLPSWKDALGRYLAKRSLDPAESDGSRTTRRG